MAEDSLDWVRLQKALAVEAERGYSDIVGKQYRFSEFICLSLGKPPKNVNNRDRLQWQDLQIKLDFSTKKLYISLEIS